MRSAVRSRPVGAATRLTLRSAARNMHNDFGPSELERRGPRSGLKCGPQGSRWMRSAQLLARSPNSPN
eukprot:6362849-Alexandrium_andersonii.AAC.1